MFSPFKATRSQSNTFTRGGLRGQSTCVDCAGRSLERADARSCDHGVGVRTRRRRRLVARVSIWRGRASGNADPGGVRMTDSATMIDFAGPREVFQDVMLDQGASHDEATTSSIRSLSGSRASS